MFIGRQKVISFLKFKEYFIQKQLDKLEQKQTIEQSIRKAIIMLTYKKIYTIQDLERNNYILYFQLHPSNTFSFLMTLKIIYGQSIPIIL